MKSIQIKIKAYHGSGSSGSYCSRKEIVCDVEDNVAETISKLMATFEVVDQDVFEAAIANGYKELKPLYDSIAEQHKDMVARYWLFEAHNDCLDDSLEPSFWQDVEDGTYVPEMSMDEAIQSFKEEHTDDKEYEDWDLTDDYYRKMVYYEVIKEDYLAWVNSHENNYWFIAARTGLSLDVVYEDMPDLEFTTLNV